MGGNKAFLPFPLPPIHSKQSKEFHEIDILLTHEYLHMKSIFNHVYISCKYNQYKLFKENKYINKACFIIEDNNEIYAPIIGICEAFKLNKDIFVISLGTPFITHKSINNICHSKQLCCAVTDDGIHPLIAFIPINSQDNFINSKNNYNYRLYPHFKYAEHIKINQIEGFNMNNINDYKQSLEIIYG